MTTKEWFMRGMWLRRRVVSLQQRQTELWERATSMTANPSGDVVDGTRDPHRLEWYAMMAELIAEEQAELERIDREITLVIQQLPDMRHREIMERRYLRNQSWEEIAVGMHYTYRRITQLHGEALKASAPLISA